MNDRYSPTPTMAIAAAALVVTGWLATQQAAGQTNTLGSFEDSICQDNSHGIFHECALRATRSGDPARTLNGRPDFSGYWRRRAWAFEDLEAHPVTADDFGGVSAVRFEPPDRYEMAADVRRTGGTALSP